MSRPLKNIIRDRLWDFIAALLLSFSLGLLWSRAFLGEGHEAGILLRCAAFILAFTVIDCLPRAWMKAALLFAAAAAGIGLFFFGTGPVFGLVQGAKAMFLEWVLGQNAAVWYADELRTLFCLIFCAFLPSMRQEIIPGSGLSLTPGSSPGRAALPGSR